jgi:hypothetical protein
MEIDRKSMRATERRKIVLVSLTDTDKSYSLEDVSGIKNRTEITTQQLSLRHICLDKIMKTTSISMKLAENVN